MWIFLMDSRTPKQTLWALYNSSSRAFLAIFLLTLTYLSSSNGYTTAAIAFGIFTLTAIVFAVRKFSKEKERAKYFVQDTHLLKRGS